MSAMDGAGANPPKERGKAEKKKKKKGSASEDASDVAMGQLPPHLELQRSRVVLDKDAPIYTQALQYSGAYMSMGFDNSLRFEAFQKDFRVEVKSLSDELMVVDLINIDASIANAFRRILIAEVPTMAIEKVFIANNTSVIQDENLAHRLGMVPIRVDPRLFTFRSDGESAVEENTIVFRLKAKCQRQNGKIVGSRVLSGQMEWLDSGSQWPPESEKKYTGFSQSQREVIDFKGRFPKPTYDDIVLAKVRPGQEIELEAHAVKGLGKTHAKWSPVATAAYRMLPEVHFLEPMEGDMADAVVRKCPVGVFDIEDLGEGRRRARAAEPRKCTLCRECLREDGWDKYIQLRRVKHHFIFSIEATGALPPDVLFTEAVKILQSKASRIATELTN